MKKNILFAFIVFGFLIMSNRLSAQEVSTPGTGINWTADSLAIHFPEAVSPENDGYLIIQKVIFTEGDTFTYREPVKLTFADTATFEFNGSAIDIAPDTRGEWTAQDTTVGFLRIKFSETDMINFRNLYISYSLGMNIVDTEVDIYDVEMYKTYHKGNNLSGAMSFLRADVRIFSSVFIESQRSAINLPAGSGASLEIYDCLFQYNDFSNGNYPQVNIGGADEKGVIVQGSTFLGKYERAGGLAFLNIGSDYPVLIQDNYFYQNRYGVAVNGRGLIATILNNVIDENNIEGKPALGGSGINILGDSSIVVIAAGNEISRNLWGVTIQKSGSNRAPYVSFGKLEPDNPLDTGGNYFWGNTNSDELFALFNNTPDTVYAQKNRWEFETAEGVESVIMHHFDDSSLGWVLYDSFYVTPDTSTSTLEFNLPKAELATIYPNPVIQDATVLNVKSSMPLTGMKIYDLFGRIVFSENLPGVTELRKELIGLTSGAYWVWLTDGNHQQTIQWQVVKK